MILKIKKLTDDAIIPVKAHPTDSGFDLFANEDVVIGPGEIIVVKTGISIELPPGHEAQIRNKSGITVKTDLDVKLGTVDEGYTGEVGIMVRNLLHPGPYKTDTLYTIKPNEMAVFGELYNCGSYAIRKGDKLAQMVIAPVAHPEIMLVEELSDTERGSGGYGSTGTSVNVEVNKDGLFIDGEKIQEKLNKLNGGIKF